MRSLIVARRFLMTAYLSCIGVVLNAADSTRPNIVLVMSDDQGFGDIGLHGNEKIQTPTLDRFAKEGVQLTRFYVSPVCSPTRASLMTGRYHYRTGVIHARR
jgi:arylsulfatase A